MNAEFIADLAHRFSPGRKALVGVSGGRDSVALWHALREAGFRRLVICHLDHGLRAAASDGDARFVRRLAIRWGHPCEVGKVDVARLARDNRWSIETAARNARHAFFAEQSRKHRCRRLFLAHHADDQVETVLHQFFRGSGLAGLGGMPTEGRLDLREAPDRPPREMRVIRPLLGVWREEIDAYLGEHRLRYREDESNADRVHSTRNRWRHELIPLLGETLGRDPRPAVARLADIAREEDAALASWLEERWESLTTGPGGERLRLAPLRGLPVAMQRRALKRWLEERGVPGIGFELVERIRAILPAGAGHAAKVNLPGDRHARRRAGELFLERPA